MEYCEGGDIMYYILNRKYLTEFESLKYTSKEKIGVNNYEDNIL